jgi:hypothetical protein
MAISTPSPIYSFQYLSEYCNGDGEAVIQVVRSDIGDPTVVGLNLGTLEVIGVIVNISTLVYHSILGACVILRTDSMVQSPYFLVIHIPIVSNSKVASSHNLYVLYMKAL